jgi:hypothetical protein
MLAYILLDPITLTTVGGVVLIIIGGVVAGLFIIDLGITIFYNCIWKPNCRLMRRAMMKDACVGPCPAAGTTCVAAVVRPYGPYGWFGWQDAGCACMLPAAAAKPITLTGQVPQELLDKINEGLAPAHTHTHETNEAIEATGH